jgi:beta-phosphoglucomutase-like phosphatase (HAD superfamily)
MAKPAVLFDFDGTLGDTETPAMEVAFWEVAPYLPGLPTGALQ